MYRGHGLGGNEVYPTVSAVPEKYTHTHWIIDESISFLETRDPDNPFFLWMVFEAPHSPFDPPEPYDRMYDHFTIPAPACGDWVAEAMPPWLAARVIAEKFDQVTPEILQEIRRRYYGQISHIDYQLGRFLGELRTRGLYDDTLIVFTADHGEHLGDHGLFGKATFLQSSGRVPLIVRPSRREALAHPALELDSPVLTVDLFPTLLQAAGLEPPSDVDGHSLLPAMSEGCGDADRIVCGEAGRGDGTAFALGKGFKYIYYAAVAFTGESVRGLSFERRWTTPGVHPYDEITWELRTANISNELGKTVFEQTDIEVPTFWSQLATNVVVSKYFRGHIGTPQREKSVKQLIDRVVNTIAVWAHAQHYFATEADLQTFRAELTHLLVHQKMAFNSPVWFNVGVEERPQCSACFINSVQDSMSSIMDLAKTEAMLFKYGSGAGVNLSTIRGSKERMSGGGIASGPVSFMKGFDAFAGVVKCTLGSTYIVTTDGLLRIEEAIPTAGPEGFEASDAVTLNTPAGPTTISQIYRSPLAPVRKMTLRSGLTLTGTREHPVLTLSKDFQLEWRALSSVRPGTRVAVERRRELWPAQAPSLTEFRETYKNQKRALRYPTEVTPELARLLGYLVAEGAIDDGRLRFTSADPEIMTDFCRCVDAVFGIDPTAQVTSRTNPKTGVVTHQIALSWVGALQFLEYCGLPAGRSDRKAVPVIIRRSPRSLVLEFLGAYAEGDGHIGRRSVEFASASEWLAEELQLLALNLQVVGRRSTINGYQRLAFLGEDAAHLARLLHPYLVTPRKRAAAAALWAAPAGGRNPNLDVIPGLVSALKSLFTTSNGWARTPAGEAVQTGFGLFNRATDNVSYARALQEPGLIDTVTRLSPALGSTLAAVLDDGYLWDEVATIRDDGEALTYDFTVPGVHAFVSNGIVSHNSGGKTRRAAKMVILDADHPDVLDFIESKASEEKKAWALIEAGYDGSFTGEAYGSIFFQNANHSVRVTDDFMRAVEADGPWTTHEVNTGAAADTHQARTIFRKMAEAAWICGDPGIQYDTTINDWHTSSNTDRIYASNPCVTGDTLVATDQGWRRIDELVGQTVDVIGSDGNAHRVTRVFPTGRKQVFELRTVSGYRVRITADHKVATARGDVPVKDLTTRDRIHLGMPGFGSQAVDEGVAEAVGLAVGDGCLVRSTQEGRVQEIVILTMHADEAAVLARVAGVVNGQKQLLKAVGSVGRNDGVHVASGPTGSRLAFGSQPVVDLFKRYSVLDEGRR